MRVQQYGVHLDAQADQYKGRGQPNPAEIVDFFIENIRIIGAAATHKDKSQCDKGDADEHKGIVLLLENKFLLRLLVCFFGRISLGHAAKIVKS